MPKKPTKQQLLDAITTSLDCYSHFHRPVIQSKDADFTYGVRSMVICQNCVERFEELVKGEPHYDFPELRAAVEEAKRARHR